VAAAGGPQAARLGNTGQSTMNFNLSPEKQPIREAV
jgi:hypothetical protein